MAKIHEEVLVVKLSTLVKSNDDGKKILTEELVTALQSVVEELVERGVVVEVETA